VTPEAADPAELAVHLARQLESADLPYAIGGAIAYGFWGNPRGTRDLDVNVFLPASEGARALDVLVEAGVRFDRAAALRAAAERGEARGVYGSIPVDVFFSRGVVARDRPDLQAIDRSWRQYRSCRESARR
jgi:hypothetical protein